MVIGDISLNGEDKNKLFKVIKEIDHSMTRIDGEKDFIKEAVEAISEELKIPKKLINRLAKTYHKQNFDQEVATNEQFQSVYEEVCDASN